MAWCKHRYRTGAVLLLLGGGCAPATPVPNPPAADPGVYDFQREGRFPAAPAVPAEPASGVRTATDSTAIGAEPQRPPRAATLVDSWCVQVYATGSQLRAQEVATEVETYLSETVYVRYVEPYYKVYVGSCPSRDVCDRLLDRLRSAGYDSAWIVRRPR